MHRGACHRIGKETEQEVGGLAGLRRRAHDRAIVLAQDLE
jgi:hypothetical protein